MKVLRYLGDTLGGIYDRPNPIYIGTYILPRLESIEFNFSPIGRGGGDLNMFVRGLYYYLSS
jgi:hypothetical protein